MSKKSKTSSLPTVGGVLEVPKGPALHDDKSENDQSSEEKLRWSTGEISISQKDEEVDTLETVLTPQRDLSGDVSWRVEGQEITYVREIGKGSFGSVYFATMRGVDVAVKKLFKTEYDDDLIHDFVHEVSMMTKLRHPNVLLFMGACTEPGNLLIVTEFMPRGSVQDVLHDPQLGPRLTFGAKMDIARQTAQGMNWLHLSKPPFLHRDLKPGNLLVDRNWTVKVCDFGLSQVKSNDPAHSTSSPKDDGPVGTPLWMAPEVLAGEECDEASDVYSYGIVLWEIYTRSEPYPDIRSFDELVERVLDKHERPEWPLGAPESLKELTAMCWHKSRKSRPSFQEILDSFNDILIEGSLHEKRARRFWSRRLWGREAVAWPQFRDALAAELEAKRRYHMANNPNAHKNHRRHHRSKAPPAAPRRSAGVSGYDIETHRDDDHRSEASEIDSGATPAPFVHIDGADDTQWRCVLALLLAASPGSADMSSTDGSPSGRSDGAALRRSFSVASMTNSGGVTGSSTRGVAAATSDDTSNILITMEAFGRFLRYAGPFDVNLVERVERLLRQPWFWGDVPTAQAEALVQKHGRGSFLIRFSSSDVGGFSITVLSRSSRIKHYRIAHKDDQFQLGKETRLSLFEIVDEFGDELYMKEACPSSPFQALFEVKLGTELSGYFNVDDFDDGYETRTLSSDNENLS